MNHNRLVLFLDGKTAMLPVYQYNGASFTGDPTAYVKRNGETVWVSPGESADWVETKLK